MTRSRLAVTTLFAVLGLTACERGETTGDARPGSSSAISSRIEMAVTADGFVPSQARVHVGQPVTLVVTRKEPRTCVTDIVIKDYGISKPLPLGEPVTLTFTPTAPGPIRYACAMNMVAGELVAE